MKRNLSEIEQRMLVILKKNSRKTILEIAGELGISRITAKKTLDRLTSEGQIKNFTITLNEEERDLVLVFIKDIKIIPPDLINESFSLIDGTHIVVMYYDNLLKIKDTPVLDVKIATGRTAYEGVGRLAHIHCDYCGREITGPPIVLEIHGKTSYACCTNCERDLKKRKEILSRNEG